MCIADAANVATRVNKTSSKGGEGSRAGGGVWRTHRLRARAGAGRGVPSRQLLRARDRAHRAANASALIAHRARRARDPVTVTQCVRDRSRDQ
ncbi:hypothetical protein B5X24_HaOG207784 [Helicoverpa armigera]|nr:hypothetical protein B5X24_HaOG207784 [Helicoverpa armigera]